MRNYFDVLIRLNYLVNFGTPVGEILTCRLIA